MPHLQIVTFGFCEQTPDVTANFKLQIQIRVQKPLQRLNYSNKEQKHRSKFAPKATAHDIAGLVDCHNIIGLHENDGGFK